MEKEDVVSLCLIGELAMTSKTSLYVNDIYV